MGMTGKELDNLAALGERLAVHRRRLGLEGTPDEDVETAQCIVSTLVLFADHGKVPEPLQEAIGHQMRAVRLRHEDARRDARREALLRVSQRVADHLGA